MTLSSILVFIAFGVLFRLLVWGRGRGWVLFLASALAVYWLQPASPVRNLDFWFPTLTLAVAALGWAFTSPQGGAGATPAESRSWRANAPAAAALLGVALLVGLTRLLPGTGIIIPSRPPALEQVLVGLAALGLLVGLLGRVRLPAKALWGVIALLLGLLVLLKAPPLAQAVSAWLRGLNNQSATLAAATDLRWLGFSYIAFRLLHTLRDRQAGRLPGLSLLEYASYVIFYPALAAGPIDRVERFRKDLNQPGLDRRSALLEGGQRIVMGIFKKFALADTLALVALNDGNALQAGSGAWLWVLLYAYALRIYFDFSGYTDIAIGLGILLHALVLVGCFLAWSWHPMLSMWASFMTDVWFSVRICVFVTGFLAIFLCAPLELSDFP